ncbi:MAG TPA: hypothetical protein VE975_07820 [Actinomycetota bacterium]|nr:hypothetical protein [Actinomycetota bacterium]
MDKLHEPKSESLRALFWRDEILQVMFWLKGEGLGDRVDPLTLERFLGVDAQLASGYLDKLVEEGLLARGSDDLYELTDQGHLHGARVFADEFSELTRPAHGECGADCWCHTSVEEAEACAAERASPDSPHRH